MADKLRPEGGGTHVGGVEEAKAQLEKRYDIAEDDWMRAGPWAAGSTFTMADCAAAPALFYAKRSRPLRRRARGHLGA